MDPGGMVKVTIINTIDIKPVASYLNQEQFNNLPALQESNLIFNHLISLDITRGIPNLSLHSPLPNSIKTFANLQKYKLL